MPNEVILIFSMIFIFLSVVVFYKFFGTKGLYCFSVFATICANIEVLILIKAFGLEQTLGNILFASTFLITDIVSEVDGKKEANKVVNASIATSVIFVVVTQMWLQYTPASEDFAMQAIQTLFKSTPRLVIASLLVFALTQKFDVWLYHKWWNFTTRKFKNKRGYLFIRNNGSTLVSQLLNAVLFNFFAFYGVYELKTVLTITLSTYIIYVFTSLADTPFVYLARKIAEQKKPLWYQDKVIQIDKEFE